MEAPNWSRDGKTLIFNRDGHIWTIPAEGGTATTAQHWRCDKVHRQPWTIAGWQVAGDQLCSMPGKPETRVYIVPSAGGEPRLLTENPSSYFHSWSPDGKTIAFTRPNHSGRRQHPFHSGGGRGGNATDDQGRA